MKTVFTFLLLISCLVACHQKPSLVDIEKLFESFKYDEVIDKAQKLMDIDSLKTEMKLFIGKSYTEKGEYNNALPYLEYAKENDSEKPWIKAWAMAYMGKCYYMLEDYEKSRKYLNASIELNADENSTRYAELKRLYFGFDDFYKDWKIVESDHFIFHFQNMQDFEASQFIKLREDAYKEINKFFGSKLPRKIDFYAWNSREDARNLWKRNLGFANPPTCIIHSHIYQSLGHEITHVISYHVNSIEGYCQFINEGTAVCFDLSNRDMLKLTKNWVKENHKKVSILDIWENWDKYPHALTYPLGGAFVKELLKHVSKEDFLEFVSNQTYENAKKVFGSKIDQIIKDLENDVNSEV